MSASGPVTLQPGREEIPHKFCGVAKNAEVIDTDRECFLAPWPCLGLPEGSVCVHFDLPTFLCLPLFLLFLVLLYLARDAGEAHAGGLGGGGDGGGGLVRHLVDFGDGSEESCREVQTKSKTHLRPIETNASFFICSQILNRVM